MTVEAIKEAIAELPEEQRAALAAWCIDLGYYDDWDRQMTEDFSTGGRAGPLADKIDQRIDQSEFADLRAGLRQRRSQP